MNHLSNLAGMQSKDNNKVTISVILPVYNVEAWIGECIDSLKRQKLEGMEFIIVDDCSSDDSMKMAEAWADEDNRVRIIRNDMNIGAGPSRNRGIEIARGEYFSFIDSDDWLSDDYYETLYAKAKENGSDIVKCTHTDVYEDSGTLYYSRKSSDSLNIRIVEGIKKGKPLFETFSYAHWTAIYSSRLFLDGIARYGTSRNAQDVTFQLKICYRAENILVLDEPTYYYRHRTNAATSEYSLKRAFNELKALEESAEFIAANPPQIQFVDYIKVKMKGYLSTYYYALKDEGASSEDMESYHERFERIANNLGAVREELIKCPEIGLFLKYNHPIPDRKKLNDKHFLDGVTAWTDFFVHHNSYEEKKEYYKEYAGEIVRLANNCSEDRSSNTIYRIRALAYCMRQLFRLRPRDSIRVVKLLINQYSKT